MKNENAVKQLKMLKEHLKNDMYADDVNALNAAIKALEQNPTDEWQNGYDMAWEEAKVFYEKEEPTSPCDLCRFNLPSSVDGKPCTMCPAEKGGECKKANQEPSEDMTIAYLMGYYADKEPCEDAVSRQDVISVINILSDKMDESGKTAAEQFISAIKDMR